MKNKKKLTIGAALLLSIMLTGCAEQGEKGAQSQDPNAYAKVTYSYSYANKNESQPSEESADVAINGDVMWGMGKTFDEINERYGDITWGNFNVYSFENGYGRYAWDAAGGIDPTQNDRDENIEMVRGRGGCIIIEEISIRDFLIGDLSTVTLENIAEKCGFEVVQLNPTPGGETMFEGYRFANYTHPDYKNVSFSMMYSENGFDDTAIFRLTLDNETPAITDEFINTLNSFIDSAADVEALKSSIKNADADSLIFGVRVFEHPAAFEKNTLYTGGELNDGAVILVEFSDGSCYIAVRGERTTDPVPVPDMHMCIVKRADTVEQLKTELAGFARGGQNKAVNSVALYQDSEAAHAGDDSGEPIIQNGNPVADDDTLKKGGIFRVEYESGQSWVCFASEE